MNRDPSLYAFRPVAPTDLSLLRRWLHAPEIMRWWGEPGEQLALLKGDLVESRMAMRLVLFKRTPFAYVQDYAVHDWPQPHFADLPAGSRAIDAFMVSHI